MKKYNWNAQDYKKHSQTQQKWAKELIEKLNPKETEDILDLGCGDGKITAEIASCVSNGSVIGVDNAESMIELASKQYPTIYHPNLSFILMDVAQLSFKEQFDIIFSNAALHWVQNHKAILERIYNALRSGGRLLLQMGGKGNAEHIFSIVKDLQKKKEWEPYFNNFVFPWGFHGKNEYTQWLQKSGFDVKRVQLIPKDMTHNGQQGLEGWIRTTWLPYIERIPEEKKDLFISELASNYINKFPLDSKGNVHIPMIRLEAEAIKTA
ncbi:MAG: methyltransferase domain-containing protein [Deltaproteobacteria bacterium]|nr:methyltransferase domain-containing protein [Deltaproteobacteria bacterium]